VQSASRNVGADLLALTVFRSLKSEWIPSLGYRSIPDARKYIGNYLMDNYNWQRTHTFNDGMSPVITEEKLKILSGISSPLQPAKWCDRQGQDLYYFLPSPHSI
jgi:putative transposase